MTASPAIFAPPGRNLVPDGYIGPVQVTTPTGRVKVRWCTFSGRLFRDSHHVEGKGRHVSCYATHCLVVPVQLVTGVLT
jgi:hypothetical protein